MQALYDVVIIGGGHNGLVAATVLARAGKRVLMLERRERFGGAAISERIFPGVDVRLSAYSYLVSLFPQRIINELGLKIETRSRRIASYSPKPDHPGLLVSNASETVTRESFARLTGNDREYTAFQNFYAMTREFAARIWPTMLEPLLSRADLLKRFDTPELRRSWEAFVERPLGGVIESTFSDDLVRGMVFTDGKIGALTHAHDATLLQNRTFLYHVIGNETGEWRVPVGGMGALTDALIDAAKSAGAELIPNSTVTGLYPGRTPSIYCLIGEQPRTISAKWVLVNATPNVLAQLVSAPPPPKPNGSVFKINMVLKRLPRLCSGEVAPEDAFAGTFHFSEGYAAMQASYEQAVVGTMPGVPPGEVYCHSLTDKSILGETAKDLHTLTLFGLDMPYALFEANPAAKAEALRRYLAGINDTLSEPIEDCLATDEHGAPCINAKSPLDLEHELNMTGGNIFHRDLAWPFAETEQEVGTWGVETDYHGVLLCGAGARRGGGVSGIAGYNAAQKILND